MHIPGQATRYFSFLSQNDMSEDKVDTDTLRGYFKKCLSSDVLLLQMMGLKSMGTIFTNTKPRWSYLEGIPFFIALPGLCFGLSCEIPMIIVLSKLDFVISIEVAAAFLTSSLTIFKGFRIWIYRRELYSLIKTCYDRWNIQVSRRTITDSMIKDAQSTRTVRVVYLTVVMGVMSAYILRPFMAYFKYVYTGSNETFDFSSTEWPALYPFPLDSPGPFFATLTYETIGMYFLSLFWVAADGLFAQLTTHLSIQFQILANEIRRTSPTPDFSSYDAARIAKRLKKIVQEHLELFAYVKLLEKMYNPLLFATILVNGIDLCTCVYSLQFRLDEANWGDVERNLVHAMSILLQTSMFCTFAQRLNDEIAGVRQAAYESPWTEFSIPLKVLILLIMIQTQQEYVYSAYGLLYLNMPQLTTILSAAMRYFTLLRSVT
ncbi:odorant receptor 13a-like isoform X2 [Diachasmimorpha longicaudata]|uniref:odorant receptor 13a-like isoform X2 n=1 Tax=Diachasmimorpha longicaudata TaxID=58733 RepID=UPI0030B916AB